jgi:CubicO group peptidase (beta-lactamase class C family)
VAARISILKSIIEYKTSKTNFVMIKILPFLLLPFTVSSQKDSSKLLDTFIRAQVEVNHFNGNILVAKSGNILYQKSFGYSYYNTKVLLDNNSVFELASVSKQFTAMGILMLIEKGKLSFTDTLRKFFPELPYSNVTIQKLLTHTSGLPDYMDAMDQKWDHKNIAFNNNMIQFLAKEKVPENFSPGTKWEYSNTAYAILASIIEKVSGLSYKDYMYKNIFKPLEMSHSRVYNTRRSKKDTVADYAFGFVYSDSLKRYIIPDSLLSYEYVIYLDGITGDGSINSTTGDLLKWDRALKNHRLLSETVQNKMFSPQSLMDTTNKISYGYGVIVGRNQFGDFITHTGGWPGYRTVITRNLSNDATIIILSNNESNSDGIAQGITTILFGGNVVLPYIHKEVTVDTSILKRYIGEYKVSTDQIIDISAKDGKLYRKRKGTPDIELKPESNTKLFYGDGSDRQLEFEIDEFGIVTKAWFINGGLKMVIYKLQDR